MFTVHRVLFFITKNIRDFPMSTWGGDDLCKDILRPLLSAFPATTDVDDSDGKGEGTIPWLLRVFLYVQTSFSFIGEKVVHFASIFRNPAWSYVQVLTFKPEFGLQPASELTTRGLNRGAWWLVSKLVTKPLYFDREPFHRKNCLRLFGLRRSNKYHSRLCRFLNSVGLSSICSSYPLSLCRSNFNLLTELLRHSPEGICTKETQRSSLLLNLTAAIRCTVKRNDGLAT